MTEPRNHKKNHLVWAARSGGSWIVKSGGYSDIAALLDVPYSAVRHKAQQCNFPQIPSEELIAEKGRGGD